MVSTFLQLHVPVRNLSRFDKCLAIGGDYGDYLLVPQTLVHKGLYSGDDWINRKQIFFYPNEPYALVTACDKTETEQKQRDILDNVLPIIYEVLCKYPQNSLVPHALDIKELIPPSGTLEGHSVKVNPILQPEDFKKLDEFTRCLADLVRPYYANERGSQTFLSQLLREKKKWVSKDIKRVTELANHKLYIDHHTHMSTILGGLIIDFLRLDYDNQDFKNISKSRINWRLQIIKRLFSKELLDLVIDFCSDYLSRDVEGKHSYSRRYWEHSRFDSPRYYQKLDFEDAPVEVLNSDFLQSDVKYFDSNEVSRLRGAVHNSIIDISQGRTAEQVFERIMKAQHRNVFDFLEVKKRSLNLIRLSYYVEAFSSSRVGVKFLHLYQVIENMMVRGVGSEKEQIKNIFQTHVFSNLGSSLVSKFLLEISTNARGTRFSSLIPASNASDDIALSIYELRCALVHSKRSANFINPYSSDEYNLVPPYLDLMDEVANILVKTP